MQSRTIKRQFWLNEEEDEALTRKSKSAGMNRSDYIRKIILGYKLKEKPDDRFYKVMRTMNNVANNLNQLAAKANSLGFIDEREYKNQVDILDDFIDEVRRQYLNKSW